MKAVRGRCIWMGNPEIPPECLVECENCGDDLNRCMGTSDIVITVSLNLPKKQNGFMFYSCLDCALGGAITRHVGQAVMQP